MKPILVILAAGAGTRFGGLKPLAPVGPRGETLLEYASFDAVRSGFGRVVLVVRAETEREFRARLDHGMARHIPVSYVHQEPAGGDRSRGTGVAVLAAEPEVDAPFAVINADDFYGAGSWDALARFLRTVRDGRRLAAVGFRVADTLTDAGTVSRALLEVDGDGRLREIVELLEVWRENGRVVCRDRGSVRELSGDEPVSMNMWGFTPELLAELRRCFHQFLARPVAVRAAEFQLPEVLGRLIRERRFEVRVLSGSGDWCGVTFQEDLGRVRSRIASLIEDGRYPEALWG